MSNPFSKKEIISLPQRNRRKVNKSYISEDENEEEENKHIFNGDNNTSDHMDDHINDYVDDHINDYVDDHINDYVDDHINDYVDEHINDYVDDHISKDIYNKFSNKTYEYKYLDHTADIILHSSGKNLRECFESICICMFDYMCNLNSVELKKRRKITVSGANIEDLLFNFLTEFHFLYGSEYFICKHIEIVYFNMNLFLIEAYGYGDIFNISIHESGTEIKAVTKHELKIISNKDACEIFVLVDI
ncbi:protein archease, putative [Plasmodium reichenowi]|uniref:Protein archease-like n=1 Tax=Plasmodium reichenowi TaxID=5854 RepID=A0A2P9DPI4_PLARE|nr:protein archease, putative [Plasmodium reichenowi]